MASNEATLREILLAESYEREIAELKAAIAASKAAGTWLDQHWIDSDKTCGELSCDECDARWLNMKLRAEAAEKERDELREQLKAAEDECLDQARTNGMESVREATLRGELASTEARLSDEMDLNAELTATIEKLEAKWQDYESAMVHWRETAQSAEAKLARTERAIDEVADYCGYCKGHSMVASNILQIINKYDKGETK